MRKVLFIFLLPACLFSWGSAEVFRKYPNRYFVETGFYEGDGVNQALQAGFLEIHSIEISERYCQWGKENFTHYPNVHIWLGDSGLILGQVIASMNEPITFWLDGHWSGGETGKGETNTPILRELQAIQTHPIKSHTILIDDVRCFGTEDFDYVQLSEVIQKIKQINPRYEITYEYGYKERDILVAKIPKNSK